MNKSLKLLTIGTLLGFLSAGVILVASEVKKIKKENDIKVKELKELDRLKKKYETKK